MKKTKEQKQIEPIEESWKFWFEVIFGGDQNSISQQMVRAIWDDVVFKLIIECWQIETERNPDQPHLNQRFSEFLVRSYIDNQATVIRRISDTYPLRGDRGVFSLKSLVEEIKLRRDEITRKKFFEILDLTYDVNNGKERYRKPIFITVNEGPSGLISKDHDTALSKYMHEYFDEISGVCSKESTPNDLPSQEFFTFIEKKFEDFARISLYTTKNLAHASTPYSRQADQLGEIRISFQEIWNAHRDIFIILNLLSRLLTGGFMKPLSFADDQLFEYWDKPVIQSGDVPLLKAKFNEFRKETESWSLHIDVNNWLCENSDK